MLRALLRDRKKCETNSGPLSEVMWEGTPCLENMWRRKSFASLGDVIVSWVGMNIHCFDKQSTTTRMEVNPEDGGSCSMKSIDMEFHGFLGMGSCFNKPKGLCLRTFMRVQVV